MSPRPLVARIHNYNVKLLQLDTLTFVHSPWWSQTETIADTGMAQKLVSCFSNVVTRCGSSSASWSLTYGIYLYRLPCCDFWLRLFNIILKKKKNLKELWNKYVELIEFLDFISWKRLICLLLLYTMVFSFAVHLVNQSYRPSDHWCRHTFKTEDHLKPH